MAPLLLTFSGLKVTFAVWNLSIPYTSRYTE